MAIKLQAGTTMPQITLPRLGGGTVTTGTPEKGHDWQMVVVYRGKHCPLCTRYLKQLNQMQQDFYNTGVAIIAITADSQVQQAEHQEKMQVDLPLGHGLSIEQMQQLGLYISHPRSPQETDHPFPEPGLFVINSEGTIQVVDLSNNPFVRPELTALADGLAWIRDPQNNYPIRGTYESADS